MICVKCKSTCFIRLENTIEESFKCLNCSNIMEFNVSHKNNGENKILNILDRYKNKFNYYSKLVNLNNIINNNSSHSERFRIEALKLEIELVPRSSWFQNIRTEVKESEWDRIRYVTYGLANYSCEICGEKGSKHPVECHEVWQYNDVNLIQSLIKFEALCPLCHQVKHIGLTSKLGSYKRALN